MKWLAPRKTLQLAKRELAVLAERLGLDGLAEWPPGLLAAVDQHAAAVRDILVLTSGRAGVVELASYARGVQDAARERGWRPSGPVAVRADWVSLRLAGTCMVAMASSAMATIASGGADPLASL